MYGTLSNAPDRSYGDIHAVVSNKKYSPTAGHLEEATALERVDIILTPVTENKV